MTYSQSNTEPAVMQPTQEPPTYTRTGQQTQSHGKPVLNTEELQVNNGTHVVKKYIERL